MFAYKILHGSRCERDFRISHKTIGPQITRLSRMAAPSTWMEFAYEDLSETSPSSQARPAIPIRTTGLQPQNF